MGIPELENFFALKGTDYSDIYADLKRPWNAVGRIAKVLETNLTPAIEGKIHDGAHVGSDVFVGSGTVIEAGVTVKGPAIIGEGCEIRSGAYIRTNVILGDGCVVGNSSELKNALLHDEVEVPHFSYVGDSIMGHQSHLGAGAIISNLKVTREEVSVEIDGQSYETGMRKFGAIVGDRVEVGCNSVLNPGTLIGKASLTTPCASLRGYFPPDSFIKDVRDITVVKRKH